MTHPRPATLGQLKETGYRPSSVKDELRRNVIRKLKAGEELFPGIVGYRDTVLPQLINGIRLLRRGWIRLREPRRPGNVGSIALSLPPPTIPFPP